MEQVSGGEEQSCIRTESCSHVYYKVSQYVTTTRNLSRCRTIIHSTASSHFGESQGQMLRNGSRQGQEQLQSPSPVL